MNVVEQHPLPLFLPKNATLLMLGSFPPQRKRWSMDFYYPNFQNDMWRIFGIVFFNDKTYFICKASNGKQIFDKEKIVRFLTEKGIALGDTASEVIRLKNNASDNFLQIVKPLDLPKVLEELPNCKAISVTGQKAAEVLSQITLTKTLQAESSIDIVLYGRKLKLYRMPSSSRAYPKPLEQKACVYKKMFLSEFGSIK